VKGKTKAKVIAQLSLRQHHPGRCFSASLNKLSQQQFLIVYIKANNR
jgi:hypothetical protein